MSLLPKSRPKMPAAEVLLKTHTALVEEPGANGAAILSDCPVMVLGIRGYYRDSMGRLGFQDFGIFDDAGFLVVGEEVTAFNWNCDPVRVGFNPGVGKQFAQLVPGVWPFRRGPHKGRPGHLRQLRGSELTDSFTDKKFQLGDYFEDYRRAGNFKVRRVTQRGEGGYGEGPGEIGYQAINIHEGTKNSTGSWGCQTLPPDQWREFSRKVYAAMDKFRQPWVPYVLVEGQG